MAEKPPMDVEENELCICFHVPLRKIEKYIRLNKPKVASQVAGCYGAGTGCGWCIPFIEQIYEQMQKGEPASIRMTGEEYRRRRKEYHKKINYTKAETEKAEDDKNLGGL